MRLLHNQTNVRVEHLGLIPPQNAIPSDASPVTNAMTPVPNLPDDTTQSQEDKQVQDPLSDEFLSLWNETAKKNTTILSEIFKTVPNNSVRTWPQYNVRPNFTWNLLWRLTEKNRITFLRSYLDMLQPTYPRTRSRGDSAKCAAISLKAHSTFS